MAATTEDLSFASSLLADLSTRDDLLPPSPPELCSAAAVEETDGEACNSTLRTRASPDKRAAVTLAVPSAADPGEDEDEEEKDEDGAFEEDDGAAGVASGTPASALA